MLPNKMKLFKGFTLIELIVVMAVFLFVTGAAMGIFISIITHQRRILAQGQFLNQISYIEEYMSKSLRMAKTSAGSVDNDCIPNGFIYLLTHQVGGKYQGIKFINRSDNDSCWEFFLDTTTEQPFLARKIGTANPLPLTPNNLQFDSDHPVRFSVNGGDGSVSKQCDDFNYTTCGAKINTVNSQEPKQPRVTIVLNLKIPGDDQSRIIQTTVSRRNLNIAR